MYKLLIVTTLFSPGGENTAVSSSIAEYQTQEFADKAFNIILARGNVAIGGSDVSAMKLY